MYYVYHKDIVTVFKDCENKPACWCCSNPITVASSRLTMVLKCERAFTWSSSSYTSSNSSGVRSCVLKPLRIAKNRIYALPSIIRKSASGPMVLRKKRAFEMSSRVGGSSFNLA